VELMAMNSVPVTTPSLSAPIIEQQAHHQRPQSSHDMESDINGQPTKRQKIEEHYAPKDPSLASYQEKQFKEMAEPTARHSAHSKKLILQQHTARELLNHRHLREKEELEERLRSDWESFRSRCTKEREELIQVQIDALHKDLPGVAVQAKTFRMCAKRLPETLFNPCNICRDEACPKCVAVIACVTCSMRACEICAIKQNWQIWCERCHRTFCNMHRGPGPNPTDDICGYCITVEGQNQEHTQTNVEVPQNMTVEPQMVSDVISEGTVMSVSAELSVPEAMEPDVGSHAAHSQAQSEPITTELQSQM